MGDSISGGYAIPLLVLAILVTVGGVGATVLFTDVPNPLQQPETRETPEVTMNYDDGTMILRYVSDDEVVAGNSLLIRIEGGESWTWAELDGDVQANDPINSGEIVGIPQVEPGDTVTVVWQDGEGNSEELASWTV